MNAVRLPFIHFQNHSKYYICYCYGIADFGHKNVKLIAKTRCIIFVLNMFFKLQQLMLIFINVNCKLLAKDKIVLFKIVGKY